MSTLLKKLKSNSGESRLVLQAPEPSIKAFDKFDRTPSKDIIYSEVMMFVHNRSELNKLLPKALKVLKNDGLFWIFYPKKSSKIKTDISRDEGWDALRNAGFEGVAIVSLDETWSGFRFRKADLVKSKSLAKAQPAKKSINKKYSFEAIIEKPDDGMDTAFISFPYSVQNEFGTKGQVKVKAMFDGYSYRGILANMGMDCHVILLRKDIRTILKKKVGDTIRVVIQRDLEERILEIPSDLKNAFKKNPLAEECFDGLSYTNRKEYVVWITSAKREETRHTRLNQTIEKLLTGKKNPSEK